MHCPLTDVFCNLAVALKRAGNSSKWACNDGMGQAAVRCGARRRASGPEGRAYRRSLSSIESLSLSMQRGFAYSPAAQRLAATGRPVGRGSRRRGSLVCSASLEQQQIRWVHPCQPAGRAPRSQGSKLVALLHSCRCDWRSTTCMLCRSLCVRHRPLRSPQPPQPLPPSAAPSRACCHPVMTASLLHAGGLC